jgi:cytochrome c oxidase cbb3-type subunit III
VVAASIAWLDGSQSAALGSAGAELPERGDALYQQLCAACHGGDGSGGPGGASNLTQSAIATADDAGRTLKAFLDVGRPERGMPPFVLNTIQHEQLSATLRSLRVAADAARATAAAAADSVLVGDAAVGKAFFNGPVGRCNTCHAVEPGRESPAANLARIASKYPDARNLQNNMLLNRVFFWSPALGEDVTAIVTFRDGRTHSGFLSSVSDFKVIIRDKAGGETTFTRTKGEPRVVLKDRLQHHLDLLEVYRDADIHHLTAYLASLK